MAAAKAMGADMKEVQYILNGSRTATISLNVQEFHRDEFELKQALTVDSGAQWVEINTNATGFNGAPVANGKVEWELQQQPANLYPDAFPSFNSPIATPWGIGSIMTTMPRSPALHPRWMRRGTARTASTLPPPRAAGRSPWVAPLPTPTAAACVSLSAASSTPAASTAASASPTASSRRGRTWKSPWWRWIRRATPSPPRP